MVPFRKLKKFPRGCDIIDLYLRAVKRAKHHGGISDNVFGRCCGGSWKGNGSGGRIWESGCGGYVGGKPALRHYKDGLFAQAQTTTWERGTNATVMWESKAYHRGGYAYRLCRVRRGKTWKVNERCFRRGHLKFASKQRG